MIIRKAHPADAESLIGLIADAENSGNMMFDPGERKMTPAGLSKRIEAMKQAETSAILVAESDGGLAGYLFIIGSETNRTRHSAYLAIGIHSSSRGQGVGTKLFEQADKWAIENSISRLELTVMVRNHAGVALYQKMGFLIEGTKKSSLKVDGEYIDEYYMAKLIGV